MKSDEELPSGKKILRQFDSEGNLISETHGYGLLTIALARDVRKGGETEEMYFVNKCLVSRARYEKARAEYPDMPPADTSLCDIGGELVKDLGREKRQRRKAAKDHVPNREIARRTDAFCQEFMTQGHCEEATSWITSSRNTLGEMSRAASRRLVAGLQKVGCKKIYACDIDEYDGKFGNTGHLVVELPDDADLRKDAFRKINRIAATQGFDGEPDDGQCFAYLKLD